MSIFIDNPSVDFLRDAQNNRCAICGETLPRAISKDHVYPLSLGGYGGRGNIVAAHIKCNNRKASREPTGCELIWLISVCDATGWPLRLRPDVAYEPPKVKRIWRAPIHLRGSLR